MASSKKTSEKIDNLSVRSVRQRNHTSLMNELPVIRSLRKDFWDHTNINCDVSEIFLTDSGFTGEEFNRKNLDVDDTESA